MSIDARLAIISEATELFVEDYCQGSAEGRRIRLLANPAILGDISDALDAALISKTQTSRANYRHHVLSLALAHKNKVKIEKAIELRNLSDSEKFNLIFVMDGSDDADSIGPETFDEVIFEDVLKKLLVKQLAEVDIESNLRRIFSIADSVDAQKLSLFKKLMFIKRFVSYGKEISRMGIHLGEIGLIPDWGIDYLIRLEENRTAVRAIHPKSSGIGLNQRIQNARLVMGPFANEIASFLEKQNYLKNKDGWKTNIPEALGFDKWPIVSKTQIELVDLSIKPFIDEKDKLDRGCFLSFNPETGTLTATDKVKVSWTTNPNEVGEMGKWKVELVAAEEIVDDYPILRTRLVAATSRTCTMKLDLLEEEKESLAPRYQIRVTALDQDETEITFSSNSEKKGTVARALSQEFQIENLEDDEPPISASMRQGTYYSIPHAVLDKIERGGSSTTVSNLALDGNYLSFLVGSAQKARIPFSPFIRDCQEFIISNGDRGFRFKAQSLTGGFVSFAKSEKFSLALPERFVQVRQNVMDYLSKIDGPRIIESIRFEPELIELANEYLESYLEALSGAETDVELDLLTLDTVSVAASSTRDEVRGVLMLPIHPLRLSWISSHFSKMNSWSSSLAQISNRTERLSNFDFKLANSIVAANFPFAVISDFDGVRSPFTYLTELTYGSALYIDPEEQEPRFAQEVLSKVITPHEFDSQDFSSADAVSSKMQRYVDSHINNGSINLISISPGDGSLIASSLQSLMSEKSRNIVTKSRVTAFSKQYNFVNPLSRLHELQLMVQHGKDDDSFISPTIEVVAKNIFELDEAKLDEHIALIEGIADSKIFLTPKSSSKATTALGGLLVRTSTVAEETEGGQKYLTIPALQSLGSGDHNLLSRAHSFFLSVLSKALGQTGDVIPSLQLSIDANTINELALIHDYADWVIAVDPHVGLGIVELILGRALIDGFVLDYAPDFIDGVGNRVTVSSSKNEELYKVLIKAMEYIGLIPRGVEPKYLLDSLSLASGQLALRLLREDTKAKETIGLAVTMAYLRISGDLRNRVVIPVDSHLNLFGTNSRINEESGERCDLIIVDFEGDSYSLNLVEVKARTSEPESTLPAVMEAQVNQTEQVLKNRIFENLGKSRLDGELQWARWASLLRFYAERAHLRNEIGADRLSAILDKVDQIEFQMIAPKVTKTGYIVSTLANMASVPKRQGELDIVLLNALQLREKGFTTIVEFPKEPADLLTEDGKSELDSSVHVQGSESKPEVFTGSENKLGQMSKQTASFGFSVLIGEEQVD